MPAPADSAPRPGYPAQLLAVSGHALVQLVRTPSHSRRAEAARKLARHSLWLSAAGATLIIVLMLAFDQTEIQLMPTRGTPSLWPIRILTDFGKDEYVLSVLGGRWWSWRSLQRDCTAPVVGCCSASVRGCSSCFCLSPCPCSLPRS